MHPLTLLHNIDKLGNIYRNKWCYVKVNFDMSDWRNGFEHVPTRLNALSTNITAMFEILQRFTKKLNHDKAWALPNFIDFVDSGWVWYHENR